VKPFGRGFSCNCWFGGYDWSGHAGRKRWGRCLIELSHPSAVSLALHICWLSCIKSASPHLKADLAHQSSLKSSYLCLYILRSPISLQTIINMSFHYSAENIRVDDGHMLRARLQRADGEWNDSEIDLNNHIGNDNGTHTAVGSIQCTFTDLR
jgi:hypothetical protein